MQKLFFFIITFSLPFLVEAKVLNIVTSISPLNALTEGITAGVTEPTTLISSGISHHTYTFKPSTMNVVENADVLIWVGPSLEFFLEKPISNLSSKTTVITLENYPNLIKYPLRNNKIWLHEDISGSTMDPHIWLDPQNALIIIENLSQQFAQMDPEHAKLYQTNAANMIKQIKELDKYIQRELTPFKNTPYLVFHDGYQYFEKHYHLNAVGSVSIDSELPPSAKRLNYLEQRIQKENIKCLFIEPKLQSSFVETIKRDTGINVAILDTIGNGQTFADYLDLLSNDANAIKKCLTTTYPSKLTQTP